MSHFRCRAGRVVFVPHANHHTRTPSLSVSLPLALCRSLSLTLLRCQGRPSSHMQTS